MKVLEQNELEVAVAFLWRREPIDMVGAFELNPVAYARCQWCAIQSAKKAVQLGAVGHFCRTSQRCILELFLSANINTN